MILGSLICDECLTYHERLLEYIPSFVRRKTAEEKSSGLRGAGDLHKVTVIRASNGITYTVTKIDRCLA
jgi:hypothetical protein